MVHSHAVRKMKCRIERTHAVKITTVLRKLCCSCAMVCLCVWNYVTFCCGFHGADYLPALLTPSHSCLVHCLKSA